MAKQSKNAEQDADNCGSNVTEEKIIIDRGPVIGKRHILTLALMLLCETIFSVKVYMSVSIVAMTDPYASSNENIKTFDWTNTGVILSAYVWGLSIPPIFIGWLVSHFSAKWIMVLMTGACSLVGFLLPTIAVFTGSTGVIVARLFQGVTMGTLHPCMHNLFGKWIPPLERSRLIGFVNSGPFIGIILSLFISGQIAASDYGWPMVMYFYSGVQFLWFLIFAYVGSTSPEDHSTISPEEKYYIQYSLSQVQKKKLLIPWKKILTAPCVWANVVARIGGNFGFFLMLSEISKYFKSILDVNMNENGLYSSLPYIATLVAIYFFGFVVDKLISKKIFSITSTRKLIFITGGLISSGCLLLLAFSETGNKLKSISLLVLTISTDNAAGILGLAVNGVDLAPNHSAVIEGLGNQIAQIISSMAPILAQVIITDKADPLQWRILFFITIAIRLSTALPYLIFGTSEVQPWNNDICVDDDIGSIENSTTEKPEKEVAKC